ncbi:hypothetical protein [Neptunomonas sp.]|uniref:hypothetical protein n=1 Tax=Neptunomonas sp. TaxID=1971898 RepID=UPI0025FE236F|nr:hypothetical protein [Neptunomonas sp.]
MQFICPKHRSQYASATENELINYCFHWMQESEKHYKDREWEKVLPYVGSAYDIANMLIERGGFNRLSLSLMMLSAMYLSNVFHHMGREEDADMVLIFAYNCLVKNKLTEQIKTNQALDYAEQLMDEPSHGHVLHSQLNMKLHQRSYQTHALH